MSKVFFSIGMSLDGFIAGLNGGADTIQQFLNAGLVDEGIIHLSPVTLGEGVRLFDNLNNGKFSIDIKEATASEGVTHLHFKVNKRQIPNV